MIECRRDVHPATSTPLLLYPRVALHIVDLRRSPLASRLAGFLLPERGRSMGPRRRSRPARDSHRAPLSGQTPRTWLPWINTPRAVRCEENRQHSTPSEHRQRAYRDTAYRTPPSLVRAECAPLPAPAWWNV